MDYLTGLEWSTGCFGLAIGILIGAVCTWLVMPKPDLVVTNSPLSEPPIDAWAAAAAPEPACNPIAVRMLERWIDASYKTDNAARLRQESHLYQAGITPPTDIATAQTLIAYYKGNR